MSDKSFGIIVTGDIQDIEEKLSSLADLINNISDKTVDLTVDVNAASVDAVEADLEILDNTTISPDVDSTAIQDLSTNTSIATQEIVETSIAADELGTSINNIDSQTLNDAAGAASYLGVNISDAASSANELSSNVSAAGNSISETSVSMGALDGLLGGISGQFGTLQDAAGKFSDALAEGGANAELLTIALEALIAVGIVAFLTEAAGAAGAFNDSWSQLGEAVGMGGEAIGEVKDEWNDAINVMKDETGRSAGIIRDYIIKMGLAGVDSKDTIIGAFRGIAGAAFVTGQEVSSISAAFQRVVSTGMLGNRQLLAFGITTHDVFAATGMTMDELREKMQGMDADSRAAIMGQILNMKYGATANEAYKNSWQHLGDAMGAAWKGLEIAVGQFVLPIAIPAMEALTWVISSLAGAVNWIRTSFDDLNISLGTVFKTLGALSLLIPIIGPLLAAINLSLGYMIDNWGYLTQAMSDFMNLVATGDWAGALQILIDVFYDAFSEIALFVFNFLIYTLPGIIGQSSGTLLDIGVGIIQWIVNGLVSVSGWLTQMLLDTFIGAGTQAGAGGAEGAINGFQLWLQDNAPKIAQIVSDILFKILPELIKIVVLVVGLVLKSAWQSIADWAWGLPGDMYKWGKNAFNSFTDGIIDSIPGLKWALDQVKKLFPQSPPKEGPLSKVTEGEMKKYGASLGTAFTGGLSSTMGNLGLGDLAMSRSTMAAVSTPQNYEININVPLEGAVINSKEDAVEIGKTVGAAAGDSLAARLDKQARRSGINSLNNRR